MNLEKYLTEGIKIKEDLDISSNDFWYDLSKGGYLNPDEICENPSDARRIKEAVKLIMAFEEACNDQIEGFER